MNVIYTILCNDIDAQLEFYQSLFEWPEATNVRTPIFRALAADNLLFGFHAPMARLLLSLADAGTRPVNDRGFPTVEVPRVAQVNELADRAQVLGGETVKAPFATYYGQWQTVIRDREANLLRVACLDLPPGTRAPTVDW
jgi:hypothetical protein